MPTAGVGVGAARKVSPNWSQETMTCHSFNCFNIAPLAAVSVSTTFYGGAQWSEYLQNGHASQGEKWALQGEAPPRGPTP